MADFGVLMFPTDYAIEPHVLASAAEARGFESVFFPEHTHIPASRKSPWPGGPDLPKEYWHSHDPFVALAAAATVTETIKLATGICLVTERDPILMAKQAASLDLLSGGRLILGVGAGWNAEEMENHGTSYAKRWPILRERILAMRRIWSEDEPEFHGEHVDFDPIWSYPKPAQSGGPKILIGASSKWVYDRIADYADGWMPILGRQSGEGAVDYGVGMDATREAWARAGRAGEPDFSVFGVGPDRDVVEGVIETGFNRVIFGLPSADADTVLPMLDGYAELAGSFSG